MPPGSSKPKGLLCRSRVGTYVIDLYQPACVEDVARSPAGDGDEYLPADSPSELLSRLDGD
jgi:hypothetical protein